MSFLSVLLCLNVARNKKLKIIRCQLRRPTVAILVSITVLVVIFVIAHKEDTAPASPPSCNIAQGAHNFRLPNHVITDYDYDVAARLATLVKRRATAADPDLIRLIGDMLDPPNYHMLKVQPKSIICTPQCLEVDRILKQKVNTRIHHDICSQCATCIG